MMRETRVLTQPRMRELFPDGEFYIERRFGLEKSYASYKSHPALSCDREIPRD